MIKLSNLIWTIVAISMGCSGAYFTMAFILCESNPVYWTVGQRIITVSLFIVWVSISSWWISEVKK